MSGTALAPTLAKPKPAQTPMAARPPPAHAPPRRVLSPPTCDCGSDAILVIMEGTETPLLMRQSWSVRPVRAKVTLSRRVMS